MESIVEKTEAGILTSIDNDKEVKLEKYYNGRKLRHYLQLLEVAETICRSSHVDVEAKKIAKSFADHYRRMIVCIVMKPFDPAVEDSWNFQEKIFAEEVARLNDLFQKEVAKAKTEQNA